MENRHGYTISHEYAIGGGTHFRVRRMSAGGVVAEELLPAFDTIELARAYVDKLKPPSHLVSYEAYGALLSRGK